MTEPLDHASDFSVDASQETRLVVQALKIVSLSEKVGLDSALWERHDSIVSIPWNVKSDI